MPIEHLLSLAQSHHQLQQHKRSQVLESKILRTAATIRNLYVEGAHSNNDRRIVIALFIRVEVVLDMIQIHRLNG